MSDLEKKWSIIEDPRLIELILRALGDDHKKNIINEAMNHPHTIADIVETSKIPHTSGYRKVKDLINDGILIPLEYVIAHDGKRIAKYQAIFETILIAIEKNKVILSILTSQKFMKESPMFQNKTESDDISASGISKEGTKYDSGE